MNQIYCFIVGRWGDDVSSIAICGECGAHIGNHISSNVDWVKFDMMYSYKRAEYVRHMADAHGGAEYDTVWVDDPEHHTGLQRLALLLAQEAQEWNPIYSTVKDFGAVGDGVTDDTAAIQAAIDANRASLSRQDDPPAYGAKEGDA